MPTVRLSSAEARTRARKEKADLRRIDAMTDEDIARQIADDPDVAPDMSAALARGEFETVWGIDVERVRSSTGLDQTSFAQRFGMSSDELADWETSGRVPNRAIWVYLKLIEREPELVGRLAEAIGRELRPKVPVP
jgi:putative transcriptional regulator